LKRRALPNEASGASRTYVVSAAGRVVGYYALATGAVAQQLATGRVRRNMPEPIPVMVIGRLAVDREHQGMALGSALLKDALLRTLNAASIVGIRAVLLHAISDGAKRFYEKAGFTELRSAGGVCLISRFTTSLNTATPEASPLAQIAVYLAVWEQWLAISFQAPFCC
jgi:GNAT superfamily N-acetyltransferase